MPHASGKIELSDLTKIHAKIGEVQVGRAGAGQSLTAILGSCVGIGFLHKSKGIYGLAHCLLSNSGKVSKEAPGRNVDAALVSLTEQMGLDAEDRRKIRVILTGGANMTRPEGTSPAKLVGSSNASYASKAVKKAGFRILHTELGGTLGRQVTINCEDGSFEITNIPRLGG